MKKMFLLAVTLVAIGTAEAQITQSSTARFGVKGGVNLANLSGSGADLVDGLDRSNLTNFHATVFADFGLAPNFFLQPAVSLQGKGAKWSSQLENIEGTIKANMMWLDVPVNAVYSIPTGTSGAVELSAGPYVGFALSGKLKGEGSIDGVPQDPVEEDIEFGNGEDDDIRPIDFGANIGVNYRLTNGLLVGAGYGLGLRNLITHPEGDRKAFNRVLSFSVGYSF